MPPKLIPLRIGGHIKTIENAMFGGLRLMPNCYAEILEIGIGRIYVRFEYPNCVIDNEAEECTQEGWIYLTDVVRLD